MLLPFPPAIRTALLTPNYPTSSRPQQPATTVSGACICSSPYCEFAGGKTVKPTHLTSSSAVATSVPPRTQSTTQYSYYPYCSAHQIKPTPIPPPQIHAQMPKPICKTPTITSPTPCRPRVSRRAHSRRRFVPSQRTDHLPQPFPSCADEHERPPVHTRAKYRAGAKGGALHKPRLDARSNAGLALLKIFLC